jgi:cytochrome c oxidase assembly protein subunit 15
MPYSWFGRLAWFTTFFTLIVLLLGAYTRLTDAGLGCPDWPGCYGHLTVPTSEAQLERAAELHPDVPVETGKAWREMIHRYFAGILGLLILTLAILAWRNHRDPAQILLIPTFTVLVVGLQAALGMWTVTLLVQPAIVTLHLLGGMLTFSLVWWMALRQNDRVSQSVFMVRGSGLRGMTRLGILLVFAQIALGGWVSTNYAALACTDFPGCYVGDPWPAMNFAEGFHLFPELGVNYEGGHLSPEGRAAVHMTHRIGALVVFLYLFVLALRARLGREPTLRAAGSWLFLALFLQVGMGIGNVLFTLPLWLAVAHNGGAALLLMALLYMNHVTHERRAV